MLFPGPATATSQAVQLLLLANIVSPTYHTRQKKKTKKTHTSVFTVTHKGSVLQLGLKKKTLYFHDTS